MKKLQVLFSATLLVAGLALTGTAGAECACKAQKGLKSGWFTGAGTVAAQSDAKAGSCCAGKTDAKAGASCCAGKSDAKAEANCCSGKSDAKAGSCGADAKSDAKAGGCCSGK